MITQATSAYLEAQDAMATWVEECCTADANAWESRSALFESWKTWATAAGEYVGPRPRFLKALDIKGFVEHRQPGTGVRGFRGYALKREATWPNS